MYAQANACVCSTQMYEWVYMHTHSFFPPVLFSLTLLFSLNTPWQLVLTGTGAASLFMAAYYSMGVLNFSYQLITDGHELFPFFRYCKQGAMSNISTSIY